jgi:hypothetical protein
MRIARCIAAALGLTMLSSATARSATIKLAAWNMNNLHHALGEPLRSGAPARNEEDYAPLRQYRDKLGADVIALQEVKSPRAAALVFPPDQ